MEICPFSVRRLEVNQISATQKPSMMSLITDKMFLRSWCQMLSGRKYKNKVNAITRHFCLPPSSTSVITFSPASRNIKKLLIPIMINKSSNMSTSRLNKFDRFKTCMINKILGVKVLTREWIFSNVSLEDFLGPWNGFPFWLNK